jgi:hypothetical protein
MSHEADLLREIAREVQEGDLPGGRLSRMYAGCGDDDAICDVCGLAIGSGQVLYEIVLDKDGREWPLIAHPRCHELWSQALRDGSPLGA